MNAGCGAKGKADKEEANITILLGGRFITVSGKEQQQNGGEGTVRVRLS